MVINVLHEPYGSLFDKWHLNHVALPSDSIPDDTRPVVHRINVDEGTPHDHPFGMHLYVMRGGYEEQWFYVEDDRWHSKLIVHEPFTAWYMPAHHVHRVVRMLSDGPCLTLAMYGPKHERDWRYYPEALG